MIGEFSSQNIASEAKSIRVTYFNTAYEYYYDFENMTNQGISLKIRFRFKGSIRTLDNKIDNISTVKIKLNLFEYPNQITVESIMSNNTNTNDLGWGPFTDYLTIWLPFNFAKTKYDQNPITSKWAYEYIMPSMLIPIVAKIYKNSDTSSFRDIFYPTNDYTIKIENVSITPHGEGVSGSNIFYKRPYDLNITIPQAIGSTHAIITHRELTNNDVEADLTSGVNQISFNFTENSFDEDVKGTRLDFIKNEMWFGVDEYIEFEVDFPLSSLDPNPPTDAYEIRNPHITGYVRADLYVPSYRPQISLTRFEVEHSYPQSVEPKNDFDLYDYMPLFGTYISDPEGGTNVYFGYNKGISRIHYTLNLDNDIFGASIEYFIELYGGSTNPRRFRTFSETDGYIDFGDFEEFQDGEYIYLDIHAVDSRGRIPWNNFSKTLSLVKYNPPVLNNADVFRCDEDGNKKANGDYVGVDYSASLGNAYIGYSINANNTAEINNELFSLIKYRKYNSGEEYISEPLLINQPPVFQLSSLYTYDFVIEVHDYISQTIVKAFKISTGTIALNIKKNGKGAAFGKLGATDTDECLESAWDISSDKTIRSVGGFFYGESNTLASNKLLLNNHFVAGNSETVLSGGSKSLCSIILPDEGLYFLCIGQVRNDNSPTKLSGRITAYMTHGGSQIFGIKQTGYLYGDDAGISCQYIVPNAGNKTVELWVKNNFDTPDEADFYGMLTCIRLV